MLGHPDALTLEKLMQTIDVKRLAEQQSRSDIELIDVRMPTEFREVHAECARNEPLESLDPGQVMAGRSMHFFFCRCLRHITPTHTDLLCS